MIDLDKIFGLERIGFITFFENFFLAAMLQWEGDDIDNKFHKDIIDLIIAVLLHFKYNFDEHFISILASHYVLHAHVLCSHCLLSIRSVSNEICRWLLKRTCQPNSMSTVS